jgi:hypothetical protein
MNRELSLPCSREINYKEEEGEEEAQEQEGGEARRRMRMCRPGPFFGETVD